MAEAPAKKAITYHFHPEWEEEFIFTLVKDKCVCMLCHQTQALSKRGNLERHHNTNHPKFKDIFPPKSAIRAKRVLELKSGLKVQQSLFVKPVNRLKAATEASFRVSHLLAKHKKPFTDGELMKEAMAIVANTVFNDFKNKDDIKAALSSVPLGPATVTRRVESLSEDVDQQVLRDLARCEYFSVQLDESLDVTDTAQLIDSTTKEDFLTVLHLKDRTRGEDIFKEFKKYVQDNKVPIIKLVAITTDGAPAMHGVRLGFVALCRNDSAFPEFMTYHCVIHQQALVGKVLDFSHVMSLVVKLINSIRAKALQHHLFKALMDELDASYGDLILHADVRWLSRGKVLQRFVDLLPNIKTFLSTRNEVHEELSNGAWLLDLGFMTDITAKLNALNTELQGKNRHLSHMISAVNAFKAKLCVWTTHLNSRKLTHFPNLEKMTQAIQDKDAFHPDQYCAHLDKVAADIMEDITTFVSNPFQSTDVMKREKFPLLTACALKLSAYFGSTYLCEMAFSQMKIIKSKYRSCLTDVHLTDCLRLAVCSYEPNYKELADTILSQPSH
ncbi:General transcription factor II-I repeat domain-containing protein 2B [Merluccius polli]|uniref:General transcription factor II-I repeat domain-containing protein 2B n=1 Tax=Merluccius polli TaxID=89951 RepID=A0AA47M1I6_MERPO|nr:General transcription factor II-I repeat domain-containing protein 2B [Merluccius polli]